MIKKLLMGILILIVLFSIFLYQNYQKSPTSKDVYKITEGWTPSIDEVLDLKKVDGEWLTFFINEHTLFVGKLEQNWMGSWILMDDEGEKGSVIATANYPPESDNEGVTWGATGINDKTSYYFGMISNPNVEEIVIVAQGNEYKDIPFIHSKGNRFFLLRTKGNIIPYSFTALSKDGEIIAPKPPQK